MQASEGGALKQCAYWDQARAASRRTAAVRAYLCPRREPALARTNGLDQLDRSAYPRQTNTLCPSPGCPRRDKEDLCWLGQLQTKPGRRACPMLRHARRGILP